MSIIQNQVFLANDFFLVENRPSLTPPPEVEKVRQPGNLVARKFLKNQALTESFWIFLPHFLAIEKFGSRVK